MSKLGLKLVAFCYDLCQSCCGYIWSFKRDSTCDLEIPILDSIQTQKLYDTSVSTHEDEVDNHESPGWDSERTEKEKVSNL